MTALLATARLAAALVAAASPARDSAAAPARDSAAVPAREAAVQGLFAVSPGAQLSRNQVGEVSLASGLLVPMRFADSEKAARAFLAEYGAAFGVAGTDTLVLRKSVLPGQSGPVVFERLVGGVTVFGGHVSVGLGGNGEINLASCAGSLPPVSGAFQLDEAAARLAATGRIQGQVAWIHAGYSIDRDALRPAYLAAVVQQSPYRSYRVLIDGTSGKTGLAFPLVQTLNQAKLYRISPAKPFAVAGATPGACNVSTDSKGNKTHDNCAPAELVTLQGLSGNGTLTGNAAARQGRTTVYNCKGGTVYSTAACAQTFHADGNGDFIPSNLTDYGSNKSDPMSELQAYYFVDVHSRFMDSLDPSFVGLPLIPGFTNAYGPNELGLGGSGALDNAFFDPAGKMMVFGQGSQVDFAYDGEVVFHEMTHAACGAIGDALHQDDVLFPVAAPHGLLVDPLAINEGNADSFSFMEAGVNDPYLAEFDATDGISALITTIPLGPNGYIRDEGPDFLKTCQGDGNATNPGRSGEAHDDGEVWAEFAYEVFQGLKPIALPANATYTSVATPAMFKALQQPIAMPAGQQTFSVYAKAFEAQVRSQYGQAAGDYVACVEDRHALSACDGQQVTIYSGEQPFNDTYVKNAWKAFYYSKTELYTDPSTGKVTTPAKFDGVPGSFQWKLHVPAGATGIKLTVCDATPALLSAGGSGNLHVSYGKPVTYPVTGTGATADWSYPANGSWTIAYKDCGGTLLSSPHPTVATISGSTCSNCTNSASDDSHPMVEGDWYFAVANTGSAASFASLNAELIGGVAPVRQPVTHKTCTLEGVPTPTDGGTGGTPGTDGGSDAGAGDAGTGTGGDGGVGGADAGTLADGGAASGDGGSGTGAGDGGASADAGDDLCPSGEQKVNGACVTPVSFGGCSTRGDGGLLLLSAAILAALALRRRAPRCVLQ